MSSSGLKWRLKMAGVSRKGGQLFKTGKVESIQDPNHEKSIQNRW